MPCVISWCYDRCFSEMVPGVPDMYMWALPFLGRTAGRRFTITEVRESHGRMWHEPWDTP